MKFNLLDEILKENNYTLLFPTQKVGMAIVRLYQKMKLGHFDNGRFKEKDIYDALEESNSYERIPQEHFNSTIADLQQYFLRYDEDLQLYSFKDYALTFCRQAELTLEANFNPTEIEIICSDLRSKIDLCHNTDDVDRWLDISFEVFKPKMKNQVDFLDRQIDTSVSEIRKATQVQNDSILDALKDIDTKLDGIRNQNTELRGAFRELSGISKSLENHSLKITDTIVGDKISRAKEFFPEIKYRLNLVDKRLDRIQPKLRQFFSALNKPLFNSKVEKFVRFLLDYSSVESSGHKKIVLFPKGVLLPKMHVDQPNLSIIERRNDIFPAVSRPRLQPKESMDIIKQAYTEIKDKMLLNDKVHELLEQISRRVANGEKIKFSEYFFPLVHEHNGNIQLAAKLAHSILKTYQQNEIEIETTTLNVFEGEKKNLYIWEMILTHKKLQQ